nr:MAG TPA: hypothetical protein [Caudoviricetes sp.]
MLNRICKRQGRTITTLNWRGLRLRQFFLKNNSLLYL